MGAGDEPDDSEPFVVAMMNYGATIGGEGDNPNYYDNQVGVCFAAYRNLPHLVRARIVWSATWAQRPWRRDFPRQCGVCL